jgi:hypothetical protein
MEKMIHRRPAKRDAGKAAITIMAELELVAPVVISNFWQRPLTLNGHRIA